MANWLDKYDEGGDVSKYIATKVPKTFGENVAAVDNTVVNKVLPKDPRKLKVIRQAEEDAKIARERRARINLANSAEANDWDKPSEDLALQTSATADKLRFSDYPNWFDDSMLNPIPTFGPMVSGLGRIPLEISQGNYGQAAWNLAAPVAAGAGEAYAEMLLKPVMDPLMAYGKDVAKKYVLNPAVRKLNSVLGRQASVPSMGPYMMPNHAIDDLTGTNIGRNIAKDFGIEQVLFNNPEVANYLKLPYYEPGSGSGLFPTTAKTTKEFNKLMYDKNVTHLYQRNKLMHGCGSAAECAKIANAITSTVNRQVSPDDVFDYSANADNAWYSTSQMLRNDGELIYNQGLHGPINPDVTSKLQVGDQVMMGPDYGTPHPNVSPATGNFKEPNVNHRATIAGVDENGNVLINESFDGRLVTVPLQSNLYYNANSNLGIRSIVRPSQFVDKAPDIAKRAMLNDINLNTGTMDFGVSPELQAYKEVYDKVKPTLIGNLGIHADEADQIFRHILGIGIQESKMSGKLAKGLPKAKVIIQDKLREAGLTKPIKQVINAVKQFGNRKYEVNPDLLDFPGNSKMQMEASKLAEKEGIDVKDALEQLYTTTYNRPKPFALSDTDPSVGAFRQKHLSKTAERLGLTEDSHKIGEGTTKNVFYNNPQNELTAAFANFYDLKRNLAKKHPDWNQQKLFDMATLSWNSPSKANNDELVKYFYDFADNPKFEGFDYLNKVKNNIKTHVPLNSVTPTTEVNFKRPFLQFEDGGWLDKYNDGGPVQPNYNDASVSYPPNFVGQGYNTTGRNYSPAWGGQFEDGGNLPNAKDGWLETLKSTLNPHNWGVSDYSNKGNFNSAYESARKAGEKEFMWNNKRYSTNMKGTPSQQLQWSGITNDRLGIQGPLEKRAYLSVRPGEYGNANEETNVTTVGHLKNFIKGYNRFDQNKTAEGYKEADKAYNEGNLDKAKRIIDELTYYKDYSGEDDPYSEDAWQMYLGMPQKKSSFSISKYKPTKGKNQNVNYYSLPDEFKQDLLNSYISGNIKVGLNDEFTLPAERSEGPHSGTSKGRVLGNFTVGKGKDEKGEYISYYDKYDLGTTLPVVGEVNVDQFVGKPFEIYDRIYLDPKTGKPKMAMGGSMPGAVGFTYARTGGIPSNGPYAKKTMASAQNGMEMKFYQNGLDFKPKSISKNGSVIKDDRGQWAHPGKVTEIGSNQITMQGVPYPVLGISDTGDMQMMYPEQEYQFTGESVTEYPMAQNGMNILNAAKAVGQFMLNQPDSNAENVAEIFDPTGVSSWDDVYRSINNPKDNLFDTGLEIAGAVPLGKLSKITKPGIHLTKYKGIDKALYKSLPRTKAANNTIKGVQTVGRTSDAYQAYDQYAQGGQLTKLDQLTNFTNYNTKQPGGWLDKYQ